MMTARLARCWPSKTSPCRDPGAPPRSPARRRGGHLRQSSAGGRAVRPRYRADCAAADGNHTRPAWVSPHHPAHAGASQQAARDPYAPDPPTGRSADRSRAGGPLAARPCRAPADAGRAGAGGRERSVTRSGLCRLCRLCRLCCPRLTATGCAGARQGGQRHGARPSAAASTPAIRRPTPGERAGGDPGQPAEPGRDGHPARTSAGPGPGPRGGAPSRSAELGRTGRAAGLGQRQRPYRGGGTPGRAGRAQPCVCPGACTSARSLPRRQSHRQKLPPRFSLRPPPRRRPSQTRRLPPARPPRSPPQRPRSRPSIHPAGPRPLRQSLRPGQPMHPRLPSARRLPGFWTGRRPHPHRPPSCLPPAPAPAGSVRPPHR